MPKNALDKEDNKHIRYATGIIKHFNTEGEKKSLHFKGSFIDNDEPINRNIKLSKKVQGFEFNKNTHVERRNFPKRDHIYKGTLMLETWSWDGHNCMRVLAFEIEEDLGVNKSYENGELISPFVREVR